MPKGKRGFQKGSNNLNWNGGLPKCIDCGKKVSNYNVKRCFDMA